MMGARTHETCLYSHRLVIPLVRRQAVAREGGEGVDDVRAERGVDVFRQEPGGSVSVLGPGRVVADSFVLRTCNQRRSYLSHSYQRIDISGSCLVPIISIIFHLEFHKNPVLLSYILVE